MLVFYIVRASIICKIQIVCLRRIFSCKCIYLFYMRNNTCLLATCTDNEDSFRHFHLFSHAQSTSYLEIRESLQLGTAQKIIVNNIYILTFLQFLISGIYIVQLLKKPLVYLRQFMNFVNRISLGKRLVNNKDTFVCRFFKRSFNVFYFQFLIIDKTVHALSYHSETFLNNFFKGTSYCHNLTNRLHA